MNTKDIESSLRDLLRELVHGPSGDGAFILNSGDRGLLDALDDLSAESASRSAAGGAAVSAHAAHLQYGLQLMNRWSNGEDPFADADWAAAWRIEQVSDEEWSQIRSELRHEVEKWLGALSHPREVNSIELKGIIGSVAHLAYHLGAVRQIEPQLRGPREPSS